MDCWVPLIAPLVVGFATFLGTGALTCLGVNVWRCLCRNVDNTRNLDGNLGLLRTAFDELIKERDDVVTKVNAGLLKGGKREAEVAKWISKVSALETETNQLLADQDLPTSGCWSTDSISNCCLGKTVFNKLNEARDLFCRGKNDLVTKQDPPVVEEKSYETTFGLGTTLDKALG